MRSLKFDCTLTSTRRPALNLQNSPVSLTGKQTTWTGSKTVTLDGTIKIDATLVGQVGDAWSIDITTACPKPLPAAKIFSDQGVIPDGGGEGVSEIVDVAPNPCAPNAAVSEDTSNVVTKKEKGEQR